MENYITVDRPNLGESDEFGIIEVYPYLNYTSSEDDLVEDLNNLFQGSLSSNRSEVNILVRSLEAQKEILNALIRFGFDTAKESHASDLIIDTIGSCFRDKDLDEILEDPKERQYFTADNIFGKSSDLVVNVKIKNKDLKKFKEFIKSLRKTNNYRNVWKDKGNSFIIK